MTQNLWWTIELNFLHEIVFFEFLCFIFSFSETYNEKMPCMTWHYSFIFYTKVCWKIFSLIHFPKLVFWCFIIKIYFFKWVKSKILQHPLIFCKQMKLVLYGLPKFLVPINKRDMKNAPWHRLWYINNIFNISQIWYML